MDTRNNAADIAYKQIKDMILQMQLAPGASASELTLSEKLGISRTPIREALSRLETEGLIVTENRRKKVYILTIEEVIEIFDLKIAIESHIVDLAAQRLTPELSGKIKADLDRMAVFGKQQFANLSRDHQIIRDWLEIDKEFHGHVYEAARNTRAKTIVRNMNYQWHRLEMGLLAMEGRIEQNIKEHLALGRALIDGNGETARIIMTEHLENLKNTIINLMEVFHYPVSE